VARYRITVGRRIGSAALVADGLHARTDGFTSLAVLLGAGGVALGWRWADPAVGLLITLAILGVLRSAVSQVGARLMDAVDADLVDQATAAVASVSSVTSVRELRIRWIGHTLRAEADLTVNPNISVQEAHDIAHHAEQHLLRDVTRLTANHPHQPRRSTPAARRPRSRARLTTATGVARRHAVFGVDPTSEQRRLFLPRDCSDLSVDRPRRKAFAVRRSAQSEPIAVELSRPDTRSDADVGGAVLVRIHVPGLADVHQCLDFRAVCARPVRPSFHRRSCCLSCSVRSRMCQRIRKPRRWPWAPRDSPPAVSRRRIRRLDGRS
jgi:hypothetical protein